MVEGFQGDARLHLPYIRVACARVHTGAARRQRNVAPQRNAQRELVVGSYRANGRVPIRAIVKKARPEWKARESSDFTLGPPSAQAFGG